jgi:Spx/MgsR family transcriptional regulator
MNPQMKLYGISNCTTVKKARAWLEIHGIDYVFHDFKKGGVDSKLLNGWLEQVGWQTLLKKTGPTWGQLPDKVKAAVTDDSSALKLMLEKPNVIRRPVLERHGQVLATGFDEAVYTKIFKH